MWYWLGKKLAILSRWFAKINTHYEPEPQLESDPPGPEMTGEVREQCIRRSSLCMGFGVLAEKWMAFYNNDIQQLLTLNLPLPILRNHPAAFSLNVDWKERYEHWSDVYRKYFPKSPREWPADCPWFSPDWQEQDYTWTPIEFELPPHLIFPIVPIHSTDFKSVNPWKSARDWTIHKHSGEVIEPLIYFLTADQATLQQAKQDFTEGGLSLVVERHQGVWLSRDPYEFFTPTPQARLFKQTYLHNGLPLEARAALTSADVRGLLKLLEIVGSIGNELPLYGKNQAGQAISQPPPDLFLQAGLPINEVARHMPWPPAACLSLAPSPVRLTYKVVPEPDIRPGICEQFFDNLRVLKHSLAFGITTTTDAQYFYLSCAAADRSLVESNFQNCFPGSVIQQQPPTPSGAWVLNAAPKYHHRPSKTFSDLSIDPYRALLASIEQLPGFPIQVEVLLSPFPPDTITQVSTFLKRHYDENKKLVVEPLRGLNKKQPPWQIALRFSGSDLESLSHIATTFLHQYEGLGQSWEMNAQPAPPPESPPKHPPVWGLVSTAELVALAHFPTKDVVSDRLETTSVKSKQPPKLYTDSPGIRIGVNEHRKEIRTVVLPDSVRDRHCYIIGKTRMGKSTLITNLALQDIEAGRGVGVIDPHGDLVEDILARIPKHRVKDVIYFDAKDRDRPLALNPLSVQDEDEIEVLAADLNLTFRRVSATDAWGERMGSILRYVIHTLLRSRGVSFLDIQNILENPQFRARVVSKLPPGPIANWWQYQFPLLPKDATAPILNRMTQFVLAPSVNNLLSQPDGKLNLFNVMQGEKVFLVNLSQGRIGADNANLLGSLIMSQIQQAAMRRASIPRSARYPFYLYIDEFQNFISSAFEKILSEAGKYQLCLTLAHQYISQLDESTRHAILGNVGTMILFQIGEKDANMLKAELSEFFEPRDATDLVKYHAFCKPATRSSETFTLKTLPPPDNPKESFVEEIIEHSKDQYSTHTKKQPQDPAGEPQEPSREEEYDQEPASEPAAAEERILRPRPAPLNRMNSKDRVLHYLAQAEYLSQQQIIELCFKDFYSTDASRKKQASTQLSELVEDGSVRKERFGPGNVFFASGRKPNFSDHNLSVRDLYLKITRSDFELSTIKFFLPNVIPGRSPDLFVEFASEDGKPITTFWEYDTGSEFPNQLQKKMEGYRVASYDRLTFVVDTEDRLQQLRRTLKAPGLWFAVLGNFETLADAVFYSGDSDESLPFFSNIE